jgi:hypothetical protein
MQKKKRRVIYGTSTEHEDNQQLHVAATLIAIIGLNGRK